MHRVRVYKPAWPFVCNQQSEQAIGLAGWWPGGPKGGLRLIDQGCTRNNHGTLTGFAFSPASGWVAGKDGGYALRYDSTNDHVICTDMPEADNRSNLTYACWACQDSLSSSRSFAAKWDYQTQGSWGFLCNTAGGDLAVYTASSLTDGGANGAATAGGVWTAGVWHHACMVYDGTLAAANRLKIYVDCVFVGPKPAKVLAINRCHSRDY